MLSPIAAAARLAGHRGRVLLHSGRNDDGLGNHSFATASPIATLVAHGRSIVRLDRNGRAVAHFTADPFDAAEAFLAEHECTLASALHRGPTPPEPRVFGYFGYDLAQAIERLPIGAAAAGDVPDLWLAAYDAVARWDSADCEPTLIGRQPQWLSEALLWPGIDCAPQPPPRFAPLVADDDNQRYFSRIDRILGLIAAGDAYQVNLARRHIARIIDPGDALKLYAELVTVSPAPYGALIEADGATIVSASPERFLASVGSRIETRPIKGTRAISPGGAAALAQSEKDAAEHLMIVDLERNDLGRVAEPGSVSVDDFAYIVELPALYHKVSRVSAQPRSGAGYAALLRATFPGGSITGAPKVRAMQIIAELEPARRGPYCGAFGYFGPTGFELAIAIRIGVIANGELRIHVGGGIVADSNAAAELAETELKANGWVQTLARLAAAR